MKPIATFFAMLFFGFTMHLSAQNAPVSTLGVVNTNAMTGVTPVKVTGFNSVTSCDLKILYDQTIATAVSVTLAPGVSGSLLGVDVSIPGQIRLGWIGSGALTLADGSTFLNITFNRVTFGTSVLSFNDDNGGAGCQYYGSAGALNDVPPGTYYVPGSLTFNMNAPVITAPTQTVCPGTVNIPVTVANFNNVGAVSLKLQYSSSSAVTFNSGTSSTGFPGLTFGNTNTTTTSGDINISGINTDVSGISLPDNYILFTLNLTFSTVTTLTWVNSGIYGVFDGPNGTYPFLDTPTGDYYINGSIANPPSSLKIWTGTNNTSWTNSGNWCSTGAPTASTDVLIPSTTSSGRMPVILNLTTPVGYDAVCNNLTLMPGSVLTINSIIGGLSGSLRVLGTASGTGKVVYNRQFKTEIDPESEENTYDWHYFSSPVGNVTEITQSEISNIYPWDETTGAWGSPLSNKTQLESGRGYNLDQVPYPSTNGTISFTGSIVSSASVTATSPYNAYYSTGSYEEYLARVARSPFGAGGWNLLGNPFTSALNIYRFLDGNDGDGSVETNKFDPNYVAVYVYDGSVLPHGQYLYRGKASGWSDPITDDTDPANAELSYDCVQTGQGFFVLAQKNEVVFNFDKSMQDFANAYLLKSAVVESPWPGIKLKVKGVNNESSSVIMFNEQMTAGLDPGYDVGQLTTNPAVEIYTSLVNNDKGVNFAQQALPLAGSEKMIIPVGVDAEKGGAVTFSAFTRPIGNGTFYLEDKTTGTLTDLSKDTYTVTLPELTTGTGRFFIHTSLATGIQPIVANNELGVRIWTNDHQVNIEGNVSNKATGEIYDLLGRQLLQTRLDDTQFNTITVPESLKGVYLVKVVDGERIATRKVVF